LGVVLSTGRHRTFVDVTWNGEPRGKVLAVFDDTGDIWLSRGDLSAFGVPAGSAACLTESEMCYLALADFKSSLAFTFSTDTLTLTVKTTASLLEQKTIDFANPAPHFDNAHITGNVLNYALTVLPHSSFAGTLDDRFGVAKNVVVEAGAGRTTDGLLQRTYTDVTIDNPQSEERTIVGDTTAVGGDLGGSFQMGGVVVQRQFSLDPYAVNFPTPSLRTAITQPSTAQILVNGVVVRTVDLPPGYYDLNSLPIATGINNAQVIIRNAYGQQTYDVGEYGAVTLLRKGLTDYQYGVGFLRENVGLPNEGYGPFAASAHYRLGLSDVATIGAVAQESNGLTNGGVDYDVQLGPGVLHAGVGGSFGRASGLSSNGTTDVQLSGLRANGTTEVLGYSSNASRFGASFLLQAQTPGYTQIQSFIPEFVTQHAAILTLSTEISRSLSVSASEQATKYAGAGTLAQTTFGVSKQLGKWSLAGSYSIGATPTQAGIPGGTTRSVAVSLLRSLWSTGNSTGSEAVNMQTGPNAVSGYQITTTATSPLLSSYNLAIQNRSGGGIGIGGWANIGTPYATLDLLSQPGGGSGGLSATLSGALTTTRKGTYFTQPVQDGYALVDVGLPNVPVYVNGQYAGATNHSGAMVAPFLQSNLQNTISVSSRGLPMTEMLGNGTDSNVGPSYHNGTVVKVQAQSVHAVRGIVLLRAGAQDVIPMYGDAVLSLSGTTYSSPIDDTGRVYWQGIRAGRYQLTVTLPTRSCTTSIDVPRFSEAVYNLGTIRCAGATVAR
jgi:outer membrane usher protein